MKEFEENLNQTEELTEETAASEESVSPEEMPAEEAASLEEELENIKEMFQAELDMAMSGEGDAQESQEDEYLPEGEENEEPENEIPEEDRCECCGERERNKERGENYPYCEECRELMRKYPFGFKGIATLIAVLALIVVSVIYVFPQNMQTVSAAITADEHIANGRLYSGLYSYYEIVSSIDKEAVPKKLIGRCAKAFAGLNDYIDAAHIANTYLTEADLKLPAFKELRNYVSKSESLTAVENAIYEPLSKADRSSEDIDEIIAVIDEMAEKEDAQYDPFYLDYYRYVVMHTLDADLEEQYNLLLEIDETYGKDEWIHYYDICNAAALLGKAEKAEEYFNKIIARNTEDGTAYAYYANAFRYSENPDPDKMLEIVEKGLAAQGNYNYATSDLYRTQALAYLLKGDKDAAMKSADTMFSAVSASNYSVTNLFQSLYTYALCALVADDTEAYAEVTGLLKYNNYKVPDSVVKASKSEEAMKRLITNPEGDLS